MPSQVIDVAVDANAGTTTDIERLARRITRDVWDYTAGLPGRWVPLIIIVERLALQDEAATAAAIQFAIERPWLEEFGGQNSIRLTDDGRSIG
jgi:hypothetical protein